MKDEEKDSAPGEERGSTHGEAAASDTAEERIARGVLDSLLEGCQVIGPDYRYLYLNDTAARQGQRTKAELVGRTMTEAYPGIEQTALFATLARVMTKRAFERMENEFRFPDGSIGWFELRFIPVPEGVCILSLDVTHGKRESESLRRTEEQLRHAQKMEAVGRLAGGVAHDFNNLLSVVLGYAHMIIDDLREADPLVTSVREIANAGQRAADLTRQLLAFSRQQVLEPRLLDLRYVLYGMENMLRRLLGADVALSILAQHGLDSVKVDPSQIEQIIMNLAVNARDAMPTGGKLTIELANVVLDESYARDHVGVAPGAYVMLAVGDTGTGMDKATQARIFEPFFTTKALGKGTGLGLATVLGIVQQSGGHIWTYSERGVGTTFKIYLPAVVDDAADRPPAIVEAPSRGGSETVLLVEDEEAVRAVARGILQRRGYHVLEAPNGGEALLICEKHPAKIDLLLTDVVLPHMSGRELAERVAPLRGEMRVLFMSGYTDETIIHHGVLHSGVAYLQKPITPEALLRKVREVLDAPGPAGRSFAPEAALPPVPSRAPARRRGRILVVDDEPMLVKLYTHALRRHHDVTGFTDARAAIDAILGGQTFDLVLCDLSMPAMNGMQFFEEVRRIDPAFAARIVFLTGGATSDETRDFLRDVPNAKLDKPIAPAALEAFVDKTLA